MVFSFFDSRFRSNFPLLRERRAVESRLRVLHVRFSTAVLRTRIRKVELNVELTKNQGEFVEAFKIDDSILLDVSQCPVLDMSAATAAGTAAAAD